MKILIAGASGLIGSALTEALKPSHSITVLGRNKSRLQRQFNNVNILTWQDLNLDILQSIDVIINLTGENIGNGRWSEKKKEQVISSRVSTTKKIAELCQELKEKSPRFINASAIGIYGASIEDEQDESSKIALPTNDFLSAVGHQWESALTNNFTTQINYCILRFGVVLSPKGGMLKKLIPSVKCGLGAVLGTGNQMISWVSVTDAVRAIEFLLEHPNLYGAFNIVADEPVCQREFMLSLAAHYHRPCLLRLPKAAILLLFGEMGEELLLGGSIIRSTKLKAAGFVFKTPSLKEAWDKLL